MTADRLLQIAASIGLSATLGLAQVAEAGRIKCWTNNEGVRECGNAVPPEYAQKGHTEKSESGQTTNVTKKAKSKEELDKERAELARQAAEEKEKAKQAAIEATQDQVLLNTYSSEDDLVMAKDGRLAAIDSRMKHTKHVVSDLETKLSNLQKKAAKRERSGKKVDQALLDQIGRTEQQITDSNKSLADRVVEKVKINQEFEADMARWKRLKGG